MPKRKKKVAIYVDWENIRKGVFDIASRRLHKRVDYNEVDNVIRFFKAFINDEEEIIYRIFIYLCEPYGGTIEGTDYKAEPVYARSRKFIDDLKVQDYIAMRKGKLVYRGKDSKKKPIFSQKQVDMLFGLDIAHVAYKGLADRALILSCDTDMIPAMKTARINGMQVIWGYCPDVNTDSTVDLKCHSDLVRGINFETIFPE